MNATSLDTRNTDARRRITAAASELALALDVAPLQHPTAIELRQPAVAQMRELECIAQLLEAITGELTHATNESRPG